MGKMLLVQCLLLGHLIQVPRVQSQKFHSTSTKDIVDMYEKSNTLPKIKDKLKKELVRRGVLDASI